MKLKLYATMRGYETAHHIENQPLIDMLLADPEHSARLREEVKLKRLQFDTSPALFEAVEVICSKLECSKREFLEMAVWDAIQQAHHFFDEALSDAAPPELLEQSGQKTPFLPPAKVQAYADTNGIPPVKA